MEIMTKVADKSLLWEEISIPAEYQEKLLKGMNLELGFGESAAIKIVIDYKEYDAEIKNQKYDREKYPNHVPIVQIRYAHSSELAVKLREIFRVTNGFVEKHLAAGGKNKATIPENRREYVTILTGEGRNRLEFRYDNREKQYLAEMHEDLEYVYKVNMLQGEYEAGWDNPVIAEEPAMVDGRKKYYRDPEMGAAALREAGYECEFCRQHYAFRNRATGRPYLAPHHLVPMSAQEQFAYSLDVPANIVALCSNCHSAVNYGDDDMERRITKLYKDRKDRLEKAGIEISLEELLGMYRDAF